MATVAGTLTKFDTLRGAERRPMHYPARWDAFEADLAVLNDGAGSVANTQASVATLKAGRRRPNAQGDTRWDPVRAAVAVLADT